MENKSHALATGIFTVLLGIAVVLCVLWLNRDNTARMPFELVTTASVAGLSPQSSVRYRGLEVGKVQSIAFDPQVPGQVLVTIGVDPGTPITKGTYAFLGYQGVTGLAYVQLDDRGQNKERLVSQPGQAPARMQLQAGWIDRLMARGDDLIAQVEVAAERIADLLDDSNQARFAKALEDFSKASQAASRAADGLQPTLTKIPKLADQSTATMASAGQAAQSFSRTANDVSLLTKRLNEPGGVLDQVGQGVYEFGWATSRMSSDTLPRMNTMLDETSRSMRSINRAASQFSSQPNSILFGKPQVEPGPGEPGFVAPPVVNRIPDRP